MTKPAELLGTQTPSNRQKRIVVEGPSKEKKYRDPIRSAPRPRFAQRHATDIQTQAARLRRRADIEVKAESVSAFAARPTLFFSKSSIYFRTLSIVAERQSRLPRKPIINFGSDKASIPKAVGATWWRTRNASTSEAKISRVVIGFLLMGGSVIGRRLFGKPPRAAMAVSVCTKSAPNKKIGLKLFFG